MSGRAENFKAKPCNSNKEKFKLTSQQQTAHWNLSLSAEQPKTRKWKMENWDDFIDYTGEHCHGGLLQNPNHNCHLKNGKKKLQQLSGVQF